MSIRLAMEIAAYLWEGLGLLWLATMFTNKRAARRQVGLLVLLQIALGALAFWLMFYHLALPLLGDRILPRTLPIAEAGLAMVIAGIAFAVWARLYLGRNWSGTVQVKRDHRLITGGPYSLVRHPIYSGLLIAFAGSGMQNGEVRAVLAFALLFGSWWMKIRVEEQFMSEQFGEGYIAYRKRVKALIPWVA